jgi:hypothetical protein
MIAEQASSHRTHHHHLHYPSQHLPSSPTPGPACFSSSTSTSAAVAAHAHPDSHCPHVRPLPQPAATAVDTKAYVDLDRASRSRRHSLPFTFPPLLFGPANNKSSTSLIPSTAEGKPIPVDGSTTAHRISALRELNSHFPSPVNRHRYAKSTGAQQSTYSQPVIVRTYSGPSHSQNSYSGSRGRQYRPSSSSRGGSRRVPLPASARTTSYLSGRSTKAAISGLGVGSGSASGVGIANGTGSNGSVNIMGRTKTKKSRLPLNLPWQWPLYASQRPEPEEPKLPPLEAFSFKSIMADLQASGDENGGIGADLDRIAEICARSRYSLSNQYEVHMTPHGSGASFLAGEMGPSSGNRRRRRHRGHSMGGPTLEAVSDDDENPSKAHRKRRGAGRRRSVAYGTLETIMSSSRSSEEDKTKKKSASEIADDIRGRAARKGSGGSGSGSGSTGNGAPESQPTTGTQASAEGQGEIRNSIARRKSISFATAFIDHSRQTGQNNVVSPRESLVSELALPQTSTSHLEIRTAPEEVFLEEFSDGSSPPSPQNAEGGEAHLVEELPCDEVHKTTPGPRMLSGFGSWIPWTAAQSGAGNGSRARSKGSHAEGSLRQLLSKTTEASANKGKGVDDRD